MSHGITTVDGVFSVREAMWHGLGTVLPEYPTREQAKAIAHPWEPITEPLFRQVPTFEEHRHNGLCEPYCDIEQDPTVSYEEVTGWQGNVRSDNGHLLGITSDTYELVTNEQMYDIAEALEKESGGDVRYETGGSLNGGSKVWLLMRLAEPLVMKSKGTEMTATIPFYSLQNAHDGSGSFRGQATLTRIVCQNTAQMADLDARQRGTEFTFRHSKNVHDRIEEARAALAGWRESVEAYQMLSAHLLTRPAGSAEVHAFLEDYIPMPSGKVISDRVRNNIETARATWWDLWQNSRTMDGINDSAYGLVQCSIEYANWERKALTSDSRFKRTFLTRDKLTTQATELALSVTSG